MRFAETRKCRGRNTASKFFGQSIRGGALRTTVRFATDISGVEESWINSRLSIVCQISRRARVLESCIQMTVIDSRDNTMPDNIDKSVRPTLREILKICSPRTDFSNGFRGDEIKASRVRTYKSPREMRRVKDTRDRGFRDQRISDSETLRYLGGDARG